jgi:hypothetical protein
MKANVIPKMLRINSGISSGTTTTVYVEIKSIEGKNTAKV